MQCTCLANGRVLWELPPVLLSSSNVKSERCRERDGKVRTFLSTSTTRVLNLLWKVRPMVLCPPLFFLTPLFKTQSSSKEVERKEVKNGGGKYTEPISLIKPTDIPSRMYQLYVLLDFRNVKRHKKGTTFWAAWGYTRVCTPPKLEVMSFPSIER